METVTSEVRESLRLDNQLCFSIYAASRAITRAYRPILEPYGLTYPQYLVLLALWEHDGQSVNQIGRKLYLDSGTLTPLLKRMECAGFTERGKVVTDDRKVAIWLGPKGRELRDAAPQIRQSLIQMNHLDRAQVLLTKTMVDQIMAQFRDCSGGYQDN